MKRTDDKAKGGKRPSFPFYPGDWLRDPSLRSCSVAARGLWADMICFMWESSQRGFLLIGKAPITAEKLARMVGESVEMTKALLEELRAADVFSETTNGTIYNRRMVRDEIRSETNTRNGENGGNPDLVARRVSLVTGEQQSLIPEDAEVRVDPRDTSGRKEVSDNRVPTGAVRDPDNRAPEREKENGNEKGFQGEGLRGGGVDENGEPTWRTRQPRRVPEDFHPTRLMRHEAHMLGADDNEYLDWQTRKFMNYWLNAEGKTAAKTHWAKAWTNWIMKSMEYDEYEQWKRRKATSGRNPAGGGEGSSDGGAAGQVDRFSAEGIAARQQRRNRGEGEGGGGAPER